MDETEQALLELERIQGIITRHEEHMFALRGWLLAIIGGLLAAYYTDNVEIAPLTLRIALLTVPVLFLVLESRHVNLVEAVVERASAVEKLLVDSRRAPRTGWYDGPRVSESCQEGANRWWPRRGMTFLLNRPFYVVLILIVLFTAASLPSKQPPTPPPSATAPAAVG